MLSKAVFALSLLVLIVRGQDCTSCDDVKVACGAEASDFHNGVVDVTYGIDKNGCRTMAINCSDDPLAGDPTATALTTVKDGEMTLTPETIVTCNQDGSWFGKGLNTVICQISRNLGGNQPIKSASCLNSENRVKRAVTEAPGCISQWSNWVSSIPCPDTCGACANATYTRTCVTLSTCPCQGPSTLTKPCNRFPCGFPRNSCCSPYKAVPSNGEIICSTAEAAALPDPYPNKYPCCPVGGIWGTWIEGSSCNDTCGGFGIGNRRRVCLTESAGCNCTGDKLQVGAPCKRTPCLDSIRPPCAPGLELGVENGQILCIASILPTTPSTCCPPFGVWEMWGSWSTCSSPCGGCAQATRTRTCASAKYGCPCDNATASETMPCNRQACNTTTPCCTPLRATTMASGEVLCYPIVASDSPSPSLGWGEWTASGCTANCGVCGVVQRKRVCLSGNCGGVSVMNSTEICGGAGLCPAGLNLPSCCPPATRAILDGSFYCAIPASK